VESRTEAQQAIDAGLVTIDGAPATKASTLVHAGEALVVRTPRRFVSRGGHKLEHALDTFAIGVDGRSCLDAGISTGGFTDCLLQRGAARVVGVDVGYGQVHERIRTDPRVTVHERTNVRSLEVEALGLPRPDLLVADLSFISLRIVLAGLLDLLDPAERAEAVVLVKPQFEAERGEVGRRGVVRDPAVWRRAIERVRDAASSAGWTAFDVTPSPLRGPAGNVEFLAHVGPRGRAASSPQVAARIDEAVRKATG
jgi:23S rRNA (cytidine1920-2'-O)/16S rRNA (cytidine1409-2'-O)-methyltransferase